MRLIAVFPHEEEASGLIDSLRNIGFHRKDMIVSRIEEGENYNSYKAATKEMIFIKSERDSLDEYHPFSAGIKGLKSSEGIIVAVEMSKHDSPHVREVMEEAGAIEILQD